MESDLPAFSKVSKIGALHREGIPVLAFDTSIPGHHQAQVQRAKEVFPEFKPAMFAARPAVAPVVAPAALGGTAVASSPVVRPAAAQGSDPWAGFVPRQLEHHASPPQSVRR